uniref:Putative secreted peptide n=1 Tax=Rhipicephalus pulchellus TaxID=72859 RepID=L7M9S0_RHIPC
MVPSRFILVLFATLCVLSTLKLGGPDVGHAAFNWKALKYSTVPRHNPPRIVTTTTRRTTTDLALDFRRFNVDKLYRCFAILFDHQTIGTVRTKWVNRLSRGVTSSVDQLQKDERNGGIFTGHSERPTYNRPKPAILFLQILSWIFGASTSISCTDASPILVDLQTIGTGRTTWVDRLSRGVTSSVDQPQKDERNGGIFTGHSERPTDNMPKPAILFLQPAEVEKTVDKWTKFCKI